MALRITVNGVTRDLPDMQAPAALDAVIAALQLASDRVAVERNGEIAPRKSWSTVMVHEGDRLEIVHFVGGGAVRGPEGSR